MIRMDFDGIYHQMGNSQSHYLGLIHLDIPNLNKKTMETKGPYKNKIFLWFL
jgi:hypothetical protein